jgi:hypothetical protein
MFFDILGYSILFCVICEQKLCSRSPLLGVLPSGNNKHTEDIECVRLRRAMVFIATQKDTCT